MVGADLRGPGHVDPLEAPALAFVSQSLSDRSHRTRPPTMLVEFKTK